MILALWIFFPPVLYAQPGQPVIYDSLNLALQKIEIHLASRIPEKIKNPIDRFRLKKIEQTNISAITKVIQDQLKNKGYYLAHIDSIKVVPNQREKTGILQVYVSPGQRFFLDLVMWTLSDSLQDDFGASIQEAIDDYTGRPYLEMMQQELFGSIIRIFENAGYPLCRVSTRGFTLESGSEDAANITLEIEIETGEKILITGIQVPDNSEINVNYLERVFRFNHDEVYNENRIRRYTRLLRKQDFVLSVTEPSLIFSTDSLYYLHLNFEKSPFTTFDGIVGYIPPPVNDPAQKGYFTGLFNIGLKNLFGTGRRLDVYWQKPDRYSEDFRVRYREPFLLGLPFHLGTSFSRLIRDTTYIEWEYSARGEIPLNENLSATGRIYSRQVFPDSLASLQLRLPKTTAVHSELGFRWDSRDDTYNPEQGLLFAVAFDYGKQKNVGPVYLLEQDSLVTETNVTKVTGEMAIFLRTFRKQVFAIHGHAVLIGHQNQTVRPPDMFWFGGATTLRGYRENQFFGEKVGWINTEYRLLLGPRSRLFAFTDIAYYLRETPQKKEDILTGFGLGISFPGPLGILQVDYGLAKGLSFSEGKIHFRIINDL